ncbi:thioredoxin domain-containing protein [Streptomyces gobiensis]|uniref:thioredoxin domain-containing protein n=1 Tax=Streptomyces gobiensis TaxID=2875706 RepID=UPI001E3BFBDA|nr:thioredoxin domain-containing protein [Streptomyces gobiensis]UGY90860.1 DsbA family protein [Streptomyces gobiensis]
MSKRNSQEAKRAARERLRIEREKQAKKDKLRRQLGVGAAVVAVLAIAAGIGVAVTKIGSGDDGDWSDAKKVAEGANSAGRYASYKTPDDTAGKHGTNVVIGDKDAKNTLTVYEDMRCPVCSAFEQANGETMTKDLEDGKYNVEFVFGTFLDNARGIEGTGSRNALSALGAALNVSPEAFMEYKKVLFSADVHPEENKDEFAKDDRLIELAQDVKALKGNKKFKAAVTNGTFDPWAVKMSAKFQDTKDVTGTPTLKLNGERIGIGAKLNAPMDPGQYSQLLKEKLKK